MDDTSQPIELEAVIFASKAFWATLKPVSLTLVLASLTVVYLREKVTSSSDDDVSVYTGDNKDGKEPSTGQEVTSSVINAAIIVGFVTLFTFVLVLCYRFNCTKFITGYMIFALSTLFGLMGLYIFLTALERWDLPCDMPTFFIVIYNFAIVGILSIFYPQQILPNHISSFYTLSIAIIMAWNLSGMSDWAVWILLIFLSIYDLCSVCLPAGPLNLLIKEMRRKEEEDEKNGDDERGGQLAGMLYTAKLDDDDDDDRGDRSLISSSSPRQQEEENTSSSSSAIEMPTRSSDDNSDTPIMHHVDNSPSPPPQQDHHHHHHSNEVKLGLGDFIFYSLLVSKSAQYSIVTFFSTFIVILMGLGLTMIFLTTMRKPLPALPFSIMLGVIFYLLSRFFLIDFLTFISGHGLYI